MNFRLTKREVCAIVMEVSTIRRIIMDHVITFTWDNEANVWIATSNDIPGLVLESDSFDALLQHTRSAVPELLALNASDKF